MAAVTKAVCHHCGSIIVYEQLDNGPPRWWHEHSGLFCCGTADGIQTLAQPMENSEWLCVEGMVIF